MKTATRKNWTLDAEDFRDLKLAVMPADGGQIVEYSYALWADGCGGGLVIQCRRDQSSGDTNYRACVSRGEFEPQNGSHGGRGKWLPLVVSGYTDAKGNAI